MSYIECISCRFFGCLEFLQLHDLLGMRIIINERESLGQWQSGIEEAACWRVYSILYQLVQQSDWKILHRRTKDYITRPKPSGYQSIHLTLQHRPTSFQLEIQIRSARMHWTAEKGPASHNSYKALILPSTKIEVK